MTRTLIMSDAHIGLRSTPSVLELPEPLRVLVTALADVDRLVLLGDIVELTDARPAVAMAIAAPILAAIGRAMGPGREIVFVPGNHDRPTVAAWIARRGRALTLADEVPRDASPALQEITDWLGLGGATVRVAYPGVWLAPGVYATHGHYLDRHLVPPGPYGVRRRRRTVERRIIPADPVPADYERTRRRDLRALTPVSRGLIAIGHAVNLPPLHAWVLRPRWASLTSRLLAGQTRRQALPALRDSLGRLGLQADHIVFGHVHRLGPLPDEPADQWTGPAGHGRLHNTGSWRYENLLLHRREPPDAYWPGGAIVIDDDEAPRPVGLLDHVARNDLRR